MPLNKEIHRKIMKEGEYVFRMLEDYDKTREWPLGKKRIDITLDKKIIKKLKKMKEKTGKPVSRIIEEALANI
jgi:hypothetical protein